MVIVLRIDLRATCNSGLTSAVLQLLGKELSLIERLQSSNIGCAKTAAFLINMLDAITALDGKPMDFKVFQSSLVLFIFCLKLAS